MNDSDRPGCIRALFDEVMGLKPEARAARLAEACGDDEELRREVESLLEAADAEGWGARRALEELRPERGGEDRRRGAAGKIPAALQAALASRYTLEREIGRGGMATVYLADDLRHERRVAIKVLNRDLSQVLGTDRFLREIKTAAGLTHPHILPLHDSGEAEGLLYYVMPYVEGESLRDRLTRESQLPVEEAVRIAREIAGALQYAHDRGIVHRDVKPANILLEAGHAVLADFGVAKALADVDRTHVTQRGAPLGTPGYMSPEQASGEQQLDGRSDQYALGCVLYEMLAGEPPFRGSSVEVVLRQHQTADPTPVTQARPNVPDGVAAALHRTLAKNPANRFQSTGELRSALDEGLHGAVTGNTKGEKEPAGVPRSSMKTGALLTLSAVIVLTAAWTVRSLFGPESEVVVPLIAVLPFENLGPDPGDSFFAEGVQRDLTDKLSRIPTLDVIGWSSVEPYIGPGERPPVQQIIRELGADYLIDGSARLTGDSARVTVQLIEGSTGVQLWSSDYNAAFTPEAYVRTQSEIVQAVAFELRAALSPEDREWLEAVPTRSPEALEAYLRGSQRYAEERTAGQGTNWDALGSVGWLEQAVDLDPNFSLALAKLALAGSYAMAFTEGTREHVVDLARRALAITPDVPDARLALARALTAIEEKEAQLDSLQEIAPDHPEVLRYSAIRRREAGDVEGAIETFERAARLHPRELSILRSLQSTYVYQHLYDEALGAIDRHAALAGSRAAMGNGANMMRVYIHLARGDTSRARTLMAEVLQHSPDAFYRVISDVPHKLPERLLSPEEREMAFNAVKAWALRRDVRWPFIHHEVATGRVEAARAYYDSLRTELERWERSPPDQLAFASFGLGTGDQERAIEAARRWAEADLENDCSTYYGEYRPCPFLARVYAHFGEHEAAIDLLEKLLPAPSFLTVHILEIDPIWDPIRDNARFKALLEEYADDVEH